MTLIELPLGTYFTIAVNAAKTAFWLAVSSDATALARSLVKSSLDVASTVTFTFASHTEAQDLRTPVQTDVTLERVPPQETSGVWGGSPTLRQWNIEKLPEVLNYLRTKHVLRPIAEYALSELWPNSEEERQALLQALEERDTVCRQNRLALLAQQRSDERELRLVREREAHQARVLDAVAQLKLLWPKGPHALPLAAIKRNLMELDSLCGGYAKRSSTKGRDFLSLMFFGTAKDRVVALVEDLAQFMVCGRAPEPDNNGDYPPCMAVFRPKGHPYGLRTARDLYVWEVELNASLYSSGLYDRVCPNMRGWGREVDAPHLSFAGAGAQLVVVPPKVKDPVRAAWDSAQPMTKPSALQAVRQYGYPLQFEPPALRYLASCDLEPFVGEPVLLARLTNKDGGVCGIAVQPINGVPETYECKPFVEADMTGATIRIWNLRDKCTVATTVADAISLNKRVNHTYPAVTLTPQSLATLEFPVTVTQVQLFLPANAPVVWYQAARQCAAVAKQRGIAVTCAIPATASEGLVTWAQHFGQKASRKGIEVNAVALHDADDEAPA